MAITAAGAAATVYSQQQQMHAQADYQNAMADANAKQIAENGKLANEAYIEQSKQLQIKQMQESAQAEQQIIQNDTAALKAQATAQAAASDAGVSGLSVDALMADYKRQRDAYDSTVRTNVEWSKQQLTEDEKSLRAQAQGRIASVQPYIPAPIKTPDYLGAVLGAAGGIYQIGDKKGAWGK